MYNKKWSDLRKTNDGYELEPEISNKERCSLRNNFMQLAFNTDEESVIVTDKTGYLYYIDFSCSCPCYQKLGNVGQPTFIAFNPMNKSEILIGLITADIKILKVHKDVTEFCLLIAHKVPPTYISFYKDFCLTCSNKEVIIWCLKSCSKSHQLKVNTKNVIIKKASFSNLGHIVVLYHNDTIQAWTFKEFQKDTKIDARAFGMRNIKDIVFTRNGRALIMASRQNKIVVLDTCNWDLMNTFTLPKGFNGIKQLSVVPLPLDGGANQMLAFISSNCTLHFFNLSTSCLLETFQPVEMIKKIAVSRNGRYVAYIEKEGNLKIVCSEKLFSEKCVQSKKTKEPCKIPAHKINDHLQCVRQIIKQELRLERLLPILKEFGEYPEKYRIKIWSTILKLPANRNAYSALSSKAECSESTLELLKNYPLASRNKKSLLMTTMNCLIQWCPLLVQSSFLPNLVFPFLLVFQKDPLLAFELILTILLNYCQSWFEYHPLPPLNVLGIIENILLETDPSLLKTFCEYGITSSDYAWPLLKTAMSEVLSGPEWLILWDHIISFQKPLFLFMCVVAYSIHSREIIMSLLHSPENIKRLYTTQGHIQAKDLLKIAQQLENRIPERVHPSHYLKNDLVSLPEKGPYPPFIHEFPKFLTEDLSVFEIEKLKKTERIMAEHKQKAVELAEENRLKQESEAFMNEIQKARLNEVQKCIQQQSSNVDWDLKRTYYKPKTEICTDTGKQFYDVPRLNLDSDSDQDTPSKHEKLKHYERLQQDVENLEFEVQSLLTSLRSKKSEADVT